VLKIREQYIELVRGLGVESLSPAEERARVDRLEDALAQVFLFSAQLQLAAVLDVYPEWQRMVDIYPHDEAGDE
jgi:hypothetical protein